ncbi:MAG: NAD(P) transhydrogenase subunit alpha [Planctomycetaceae bacterium]|nr:NAD(P) transhydrogenase subunit alpha [Planctomycetaceae bacterium]MCA9111123.1 NAD(P) transhydrogenase subunit alpha [Planctomycetaceae bacterium]
MFHAIQLLAATSAANPLIIGLTIFALAVFVGIEIITKIPPTLHTPLMSGSNAISGITIVGAVLAAGEYPGFARILGFIAIILATVNVVGGFLVTHRMLEKFKSR